jgi:hypothetical protein
VIISWQTTISVSSGTTPVPLVFSAILTTHHLQLVFLFSFLEPSIERTLIVLHDCKVLNDITGEEIKKTIHMDVISCSPLMSSAESNAFKFRAADESERINYRTFVLPPLCN